MTSTTVGHLMTSPVLTVEPETPIDEIADAMLEEGINSIVAIDGECQPLGILTSTDFVRIVAEGTRETTTVGDHMTTEIITTTEETPVPQVADRMVDREISHLPVVDDDGEVVGILSATDLTSYISGMAIRESTD